MYILKFLFFNCLCFCMHTRCCCLHRLYRKIQYTHKRKPSPKLIKSLYLCTFSSTLFALKHVTKIVGENQQPCVTPKPSPKPTRTLYLCTFSSSFFALNHVTNIVGENQQPCVTPEPSPKPMNTLFMHFSCYALCTESSY